MRTGKLGATFEADAVQATIADDAAAFIRKQAQTQPSKPFFLYVPFASPHTPILPTKAFQGKTPTPYGDFCVELDHHIGRILAALDETKSADDTLVLFSADNGCSPAANLADLKAANHDPYQGRRGTKADLYEGGHRVPLLVRWPTGIAQPGRTVARLISLADVYATCAETIKKRYPIDAAEDAFSFADVFDVAPPSATDAPIPRRTFDIHHSIHGAFAIRRGDLKLLMAPGSGGWSAPKPGQEPADAPRVQLYDLNLDPGETKNLAVERPETVAALRTLLKQSIENGRITSGPPQPYVKREKWPGLEWMAEKE
ncbi:MAG: sulfatase-like hydrolase/transferase [Pirellulales bacterium]